MFSKMKGLLKSLRYISQMFDEEKEAEIQIGLPTDVKHVAHIGWEGGQSNDNPSWMKEFKGSAGDSKLDNSASEDSNRRGNRSDDKDPELPKSSRRQTYSSDNNNPDSPKSKNKQSRRNRSKEASDSAAGDLPDIPKKSRRKKSKDSVAGDGSSRSTRSSRRNAAAQDIGQDSEASVKSAYSDFPGEGSTRSTKLQGTASSDSAAPAAGAW